MRPGVIIPPWSVGDPSDQQTFLRRLEARIYPASIRILSRAALDKKDSDQIGSSTPATATIERRLLRGRRRVKAFQLDRGTW
jgi:hypothetical protein